jgi:DNA mismatch repair protein MutS2
MELEAASAEGLDWAVLADALVGAARTPMGEAALAELRPLADVSEIEELYDAIEEVRRIESQGTPLPVGAVGDVRPDARRGARGEVLEGPTLIRAGITLDGLYQLGRVLDRRATEAPTLARWASAIVDDPDVREELQRAFTAAGELSAARWPLLGELRARIAALHEEIRGTLERLVHGDELGDVLQDTFWTVRENRYVLPIKAHAKRMDHGIVHGTSGSGRTVFIEPHQVIALNNRLRIAEGELKAEEWRILQQLSRMLGSIAPQVEAGVDAALRIDLACAREQLATQLEAVRPIVREEGVVALARVRHPVLVLRKVPVVSNDLRLTAEAPALVISGPNAGGKTVALKSIGLCAELVRHGCWVPAGEDSRVDRFESVLAVIGDQQTVAEDLSSFSAHLVALDAIVRRAGPGVLVLLDELASGTDPAQGAAIGQAILERLVDLDARVVVTTHYGPLKRLGAVDPRFSVAAMQYHDGRPTYRVLAGVSGESHALGVAQRIGLDPSLIARAAELVGQGEASVSAALGQLEEERSRWQLQADEAERLRIDLAAREGRLSEREAELTRNVRKLEREESRAFLQKLRQADKAIHEILSSLRNKPEERAAELAKASVEAFRGLVPVRPDATEAPPPDLSIGDRVRLRDYDLVGEVISVGDGGVRVRTGSLTVNTRAEHLERV